MVDDAVPLPVRQRADEAGTILLMLTYYACH